MFSYIAKRLSSVWMSLFSRAVFLLVCKNPQGVIYQNLPAISIIFIRFPVLLSGYSGDFRHAGYETVMKIPESPERKRNRKCILFMISGNVTEMVQENHRALYPALCQDFMMSVHLITVLNENIRLQAADRISLILADVTNKLRAG